MTNELDIEVLRDLWLARFGMERVTAEDLTDPFWRKTSMQLRQADKLLVFMQSCMPRKARLREKQLAPQGATTKE